MIRYDTQSIFANMKINHLGKTKTSFWLEPSILEEAKIASARRHQTVDYIIEEALIQYLSLTEIKVRRQIELDQQNAEYSKHLDMLKQQQEDRDRQIQERLKQHNINKEIHRLSKGSFSNF
jgi:hypothetical protein